MSNYSPVIRVRASEAARILGIGLSTFWKRAKERPDFPKPRHDGQRITYWLYSEIEAYAKGEPVNENKAEC